MREITVGDNVLLDSFAGLIPCRITEVRDLPHGKWSGNVVDTDKRVTVRIIESAPGYHFGDIVAVSANHVIPRSNVSRRGGQVTISTDFQIVNPFYATTYCNCGHYVKTGRPYQHECRTIPPAALRAERDGNFEEAMLILNQANFYSRSWGY